MPSGSSSPRLAVRLYDNFADESAVHHIFQQTVPEDLNHGLTLPIAARIWALPYIQLYPEHTSCFVFDGGDEAHTAVGYIIGTADTSAFVSAYRNVYIPSLSPEDFPPPALNSIAPPWAPETLPATLLHILYRPEALLQPDFPTLLQEYPAHLHIDILPEYQRQGFGRLLIEAFCETVKRKGARGVHLIMDGRNGKVEKFYEKVGFVRFDEVLDGGDSGETGRARDGTIWLVRSLR